MFAYCGNNPVMYSDPTGCYHKNIFPIYADNGFHYILNQHDQSIANLPLGESTVGKMGCGIVAIYNALLSMRDYTTFEEVYSYFADNPSRLADNGKSGISINEIAAYFRSKGYYVLVVNAHFPETFAFCSRYSDANIMLYTYGTFTNSSGHFIEYEWTGTHYVGRNIKGGTDWFTDPLLYGLEDDKYFVRGVFICKWD